MQKRLNRLMAIGCLVKKKKKKKKTKLLPRESREKVAGPGKKF